MKFFVCTCFSLFLSIIAFGQDKPFACGFDDNNNNSSARFTNINLDEKLDYSKTLICRLGVVVDYESYELFGKDSTKLFQHIYDIVNVAGSPFLKETNIKIVIAGIKFFKTKEQDPFKDEYDIFKLYSSFNTANIFDRTKFDVQLYLYSKKIGGAAGVGGGNGVPGGAGALAPIAYSSTISHELGHAFGCPHTFNCKWGKNKDEVIESNYFSEGDCFSINDPRTQNVGSFMSYNVAKIPYSFIYDEVKDVIRNYGLNTLAIKNNSKPEKFNLNKLTLKSNTFYFLPVHNVNKRLIEYYNNNILLKIDTLESDKIEVIQKLENLKVRIKNINDFGESDWSDLINIEFSDSFVTAPIIKNVRGNFLIGYNINSLELLNLSEFESVEILNYGIFNSNKINISLPAYIGNDNYVSLQIRSRKGSNFSEWQNLIYLNRPNYFSPLDRTLQNMKNQVLDKFPILYKRILYKFLNPDCKIIVSKNKAFTEIIYCKVFPSTVQELLSTYIENLQNDTKYYVKFIEYYQKNYPEIGIKADTINVEIDSLQTKAIFEKNNFKLVNLDNVGIYGASGYFNFINIFDGNIAIYDRNHFGLVFVNIKNKSLNFKNKKDKLSDGSSWSNNFKNNSLLIPMGFSNKSNNFSKIFEIDKNLNVTGKDSLDLKKYSIFEGNIERIFYKNRIFKNRSKFYKMNFFEKPIYEIPSAFWPFPEIFETQNNINFLASNLSNSQENIDVTIDSLQKVSIVNISKIITTKFGLCDVNQLLHVEKNGTKWYFGYFQNTFNLGLIKYDGEDYSVTYTNSKELPSGAVGFGSLMREDNNGNLFLLNSQNQTDILKYDGKIWQIHFSIPKYSNKIIDFRIDEKGQFWFKDQASIFYTNLCKEELPKPEYSFNKYYKAGENLNFKIPEKINLNLKIFDINGIVLNEEIQNSQYLFNIKSPVSIEAQYEQNGCFSDISKYEIKLFPEIALNLNKINYCYGDSLNLSPNISGTFEANNKLSVLLYNPNKTYENSLYSIVSTSILPGKYWVKLKSTSPEVFSKDSVEITINENPKVTVNGNLSFCDGQNTLLSATGEGGAAPYKYQWLQGNTKLGNENSYNITNTGNYFVAITDNYGCIGISQTVTVTKRLSPDVKISKSGNTELLQNGSVVFSIPKVNNQTYQWYKDGKTIIEAISNTYTANSAGMYSVEAILEGCKATSESVTVNIVLSEEINAQHQIKLSPNPTNGTFRVGYFTPNLKNTNISFLNALGQIIFQKDLKTIGIASESFNIEYLPTGIYYVRIQIGEYIKTIKVEKN